MHEQGGQGQDAQDDADGRCRDRGAANNESIVFGMGKPQGKEQAPSAVPQMHGGGKDAGKMQNGPRGTAKHGAHKLSHWRPVADGEQRDMDNEKEKERRAGVRHEAGGQAHFRTHDSHGVALRPAAAVTDKKQDAGDHVEGKAEEKHELHRHEERPQAVQPAGVSEIGPAAGKSKAVAHGVQHKKKAKGQTGDGHDRLFSHRRLIVLDYPHANRKNICAWDALQPDTRSARPRLRQTREQLRDQGKIFWVFPFTPMSYNTTITGWIATPRSRRPARLPRLVPIRSNNGKETAQKKYREDAKAMTAINRPNKNSKGTPGQVISLVKDGRRLFRAGNYTQAKSRFEEALDLDPENTYALVGCGDACRRLADYRAAIQFYKQAVAIDPDNPYALLGLGDCHRGLGLIAEAIGYWQDLLRLQPANVQILTRVGDAYRRLERFEEAIKSYKAALEFDPFNPYALRGLADSHRGLRQTDEAIRAWETYNLYHPDNAAVLARLGDAYKQIGELDKAVDAYGKALLAERDYVYAYLGLADVAVLRGDDGQAHRFWQQAVWACGDDLAPACRRADIYRKQGKVREAKLLYHLALEVQPDNKFLRTGLASLHIEQKDYAEAEEILKPLASLYPDDEFIFTGLGDAYSGQGKFREAIAAWEHALACIDGNTFLYSRLADAYTRIGDRQRAADYYVKSFEAGDFSYRAINGLTKILQRDHGAVSVPDHWLIRVALFALDNRGEEAARQVLRHLSPAGRERLPSRLTGLA